MKIAITTPSGHIGSAVADFLLDSGGDIGVRLLGRRPENLRKLVKRGAETAIGSQDNTDFLIKATQDVDGLFWVTPPGYGSDDLRGFQNRLGKAAATAIRTNRIAGRQRVVDRRPVRFRRRADRRLDDVENLLNDAAGNVTRSAGAGFFFENLLWQLDPIKNADRFLAARFPARSRSP